ncbi:MAG TPA: hypothetical protein DEO49_03805 [Sutterella sp.]|nr:hypothetical protein [Sutterella sp.]
MQTDLEKFVFRAAEGSVPWAFARYNKQDRFGMPDAVLWGACAGDPPKNVLSKEQRRSPSAAVRGWQRQRHL